MFIRKFFWPLLTVVIFIGAMFLWFGVGGEEKHLSGDLIAISQETSWLSYDMDGFDVTLHGIAPDAQTRDSVIEKVKSLSNIGNVQSDITLLSEQKNNDLMFIVDEDGITVRGTMPIDMTRFKLINLISSKKPGMMVYDELDAGAILPEKFERAFSYFLTILPEMKSGVIAITNDQVTVDRATLNRLQKNAKLPEGMVLNSSCIWEKPDGGYWQNTCSE